MSAEGTQIDLVGRVIDGRFTLLQWLGGTEQTAVFLTEAASAQASKAAIKLIPGDAEARLAGWEAAKRVQHPHLMRLFHTGRCTIDGTALLYAVMENADEILEQILPDRPLTPAEAKEMLVPVIDTLAYLHANGLVHGHVKPSNILVVDDRLKLSGDSLQAAGESIYHAPAQSIYAAPEAASSAVTPGFDVWSLGATLVEVLTQHPPVWNRSAGSDPIVPQSIPQPFFDIARECLRADPQARCSLGDIKNWLETGRPVEAPVHQADKKPTFGNRPLVFGAVAVAVLASFVIPMTRHHSSQPSSPAVVAQSQTQQQTSEDASSPQPAQDQAPAQADSASRAAVQPSNGAVAQRAMPDLLPEAVASIRGKVDVSIRVAVNSSGEVFNAAFESEGPSKYFAKAALEAAPHWRFKPAQANGQSVPSTWILQFEFTRAGAQVTPIEAR